MAERDALVQSTAPPQQQVPPPDEGLPPVNDPTVLAELGGEDPEKARKKAQTRMSDYLNLVVINNVLQQWKAAQLSGDSAGALALNKILQNLKARVPEIVAAYGEHYDLTIAPMPAGFVGPDEVPLEPEQFMLRNWKAIFDAIQPGAVIRTAAKETIEGFNNEVDSLLAGQAYIAQQRSDRKAQLKSSIAELKNQLAVLSMNQQLFPDADARNVLNIAQTRLTQAESTLVEQYSDVAGEVDPQAFLDKMLPSYLSTAMIGTGVAIPTSNALDAVSAVAQGAGALQDANTKKAELTAERKVQTANLEAQKKSQIAINQGQAQTIQQIREQFPDRPDLALKAEVKYRNDLIENPQADPNIAVQQFAGQAEGEKRIAQGLFDSGLDTSKLPPEVAKQVMEKGLTAETLPSLVAELPAFKTQFPTAAQFGSKEIAQSMIDKALKEQPGNPMLSIQAQLQPSPTNPNAPITPAYADAIGKESVATGISSTALAKAHTGNPAEALAQQSINAGKAIDPYRELARKLGISSDQITRQALLRNLGGRPPDVSEEHWIAKNYYAGQLGDQEPDAFAENLFRSGQQDIKQIVGGLAGAKLPAGWDKISPDALKQYTSSLPEPPTAAEIAAEEAKKLQKLKTVKV